MTFPRGCSTADGQFTLEIWRKVLSTGPSKKNSPPFQCFGIDPVPELVRSRQRILVEANRFDATKAGKTVGQERRPSDVPNRRALRGRPRISVDFVAYYRISTDKQGQRRAGQSLAARRGLGRGNVATTTISLGPCGAGRVRQAHCQDIAASTPPLPCADYLAVAKAQD